MTTGTKTDWLCCARCSLLYFSTSHQNSFVKTFMLSAATLQQACVPLTCLVCGLAVPELEFCLNQFPAAMRPHTIHAGNLLSGQTSSRCKPFRQHSCSKTQQVRKKPLHRRRKQPPFTPTFSKIPGLDTCAHPKTMPYRGSPGSVPHLN